jgi:hypothetical protein
MEHIAGVMHRPTRQHRNLEAKIEQKLSQSRSPGKKAKRWKKAIEAYGALNLSDGSESSDAGESSTDA